MTSTRPLWVKICGLRTEEDVVAAVEAGADAIGFVFAPSPRRIDPATARRIGARASGQVLRVAVTVDLEPAELPRLAEEAQVDAVQPHGRHHEEVGRIARVVGLRVIRPIAPTVDDLGAAVAEAPTEELLLVDRAMAGLHGGTGQPHADAMLDRLAGIDRPFVLAGGLRPDTVAAAVRRARPWGVDVSSGVESSPGRKSPELIRRFVAAARAARPDALEPRDPWTTPCP